MEYQICFVRYSGFVKMNAKSSRIAFETLGHWVESFAFISIKPEWQAKYDQQKTI